jgi:FAD synthase
VYAGTFTGEDGVERVAAISLGRRPTFYAESGLLLLEAHVLDFYGDLYGQRSKVRFRHHLRPQEQFAGVEGLVAQMQRVVEHTRRLLG